MKIRSVFAFKNLLAIELLLGLLVMFYFGRYGEAGICGAYGFFVAAMIFCLAMWIYMFFLLLAEQGEQDDRARGVGLVGSLVLALLLVISNLTTEYWKLAEIVAGSPEQVTSVLNYGLGISLVIYLINGLSALGISHRKRNYTVERS